MLTDMQAIREGDGNPAFAVIPWQQYVQLSPTDEALFDVAAAENEASFPRELVGRLLAGCNLVQVYRQHRGMTLAELAEAAGVKPDCLSQIEDGQRAVTAGTRAAIARALRVDPDDLD